MMYVSVESTGCKPRGYKFCLCCCRVTSDRSFYHLMSWRPLWSISWFAFEKSCGEVMLERWVAWSCSSPSAWTLPRQ